jgi:hypothetical protein
MKECDVRDCKPGMVLAEPVFTGQGVLLLSQGVELTDKNIWVLKSWGIKTLSVESGSGSDFDETGTEEFSDSIEEELRKKFGETAEDEIMMKLMSFAGRVIEARRRRRAAADG